MTTLAVGGSTVESMRARVDADLAARSSDEWVTAVMVNLGANDVELAPFPVQATWETNLGYILDAFKAKWPLAQIYVMRPWRRGEAADCNTLAGWIANVLAARAAWAFVGPDERVFLEGGDDGVTYTTDGVHPNAAGYTLTAQQWATSLGY